MQTASLISPGLLKSGLKRSWPFWVVLLVTFGLLFLTPLYSALVDLAGYDDALVRADQLAIVLSIMWANCSFIVFVAAIAAAVLVNDHLFSRRAATFVGALPQRRGTVFATSYLIGFIGLAGVLAVVGVVLVCLHFAMPDLAMGMVGEWLALMLAAAFVFYSLAHLACQLAGTRSVAVLLYAVANILAACVETSLRSLVGAMQYGMSDWSLSFDWLSPLIGWTSYCIAGGSDAQISVGWPAVGGYCAAAVVFVAVAAVLYRRRALEMAGESVAWPKLRPVLKYLAGIATALLFATVVLASAESRALFMNGAPVDTPTAAAFAAAMALGGFLGVLFAEMIMSRSARVFRKCWRGGCVLAVVGALFVGAAATDALGVASRVPDPADVTDVTVVIDGTDYGTLTSTDAICDVTDLHAAIYAYGSQYAEDYASAEGPDGSWSADVSTVRLAYSLKGGGTLVRSYPIVSAYYQLDEGAYRDAFGALDAAASEEGPLDDAAGEAADEGLPDAAADEGAGALEPEPDDAVPAVVAPPRTQGYALLEQLASIVNTPEALKRRYADVLEGDLSKLRFVLYYVDGETDKTLSVPADLKESLVNDALAVDIVQNHAADYDPSNGWDVSATALDASLDVLDGTTEETLCYLSLDEAKTPAVNAWLAKNYPKVKLSPMGYGDDGEDDGLFEEEAPAVE